MWVWRHIGQLGAAVRAALGEWTGAAEYERVAQSCRATGCAPPDRGRYLAQRLEEKYSQVSRCC